MTAVGIEEVRAAQEAIRPYVHRTPLFASQTLSALTGAELYLKAENLQKTGCFKPRGVVNAVLALTPQERERGVMTFSAGNTAQALAYAARTTRTPATVVMPDKAPHSKVEAVKRYGARVLQVPMASLLDTAERVRQESGQVMIHPWENAALIAGHGTVGLEILEDLPEVEVVVVPVGGGGLISGIVTAIKKLRPRTLVVGVEPEGSTAVAQSLAAGEPVQIKPASIADGLNAPSTAPTPLGIIQELVDEIITAPDAEIARAMGLIIERTKLLVEPSGAVAVAALLRGAIPQASGKKTVAILSGGNVDLDRVAELTHGTQ